MQNVSINVTKLPYNPATDYRNEENLANLSVRGLADLLTALGATDIQEMQAKYARDTRTLRTVLTERVNEIYKADDSFTFDETVNPEVAEVTSVEVPSDLVDSIVTDDVSADDDSVEEETDPFMDKLLDDVDSDSTEDPMDSVTTSLDEMGRKELVAHIEKFNLSGAVDISVEDASTPEIRSALLDYYFEAQSSLIDTDDSVSSDLEVESDDEDESEIEDLDSEETSEEFSSLAEELESSEDFPDEQEDPAEFDEDFEVNSDEDSDDSFDDEPAFEGDEEEDSPTMDRLEQVDYLIGTNVPHAEISTNARLLIVLHPENETLSKSVEIKQQLESVDGTEGTFDMINPLRSLATAERNDKNVGWFTETLSSVVRALCEFNSANRTYVGSLVEIQRALHVIEENLARALMVLIEHTNPDLEFPEGVSLEDFVNFTICINTAESDTACNFDVVLHLLVPVLSDATKVESFTRLVSTFGKMIDRIVDQVAEDTGSDLDVSVVVASGVSSLLNSDAVRSYFADNLHLTMQDLIDIARTNEESVMNYDAEDEDETSYDEDETSYDEDETSDIEEDNQDDDGDIEGEDETSSLLEEVSATFSGIQSLSVWSAAVFAEVVAE